MTVYSFTTDECKLLLQAAQLLADKYFKDSMEAILADDDNSYKENSAKRIDAWKLYGKLTDGFITQSKAYIDSLIREIKS